MAEVSALRGVPGTTLPRAARRRMAPGRRNREKRVTPPRGGLAPAGALAHSPGMDADKDLSIPCPACGGRAVLTGR